MLGESQVGKTCILNAGKNNIFQEETLITAGIDSYTWEKTFDNKKYIFKIFDTGGTERYRGIASTTFQIAHGYFLVFDVNNRNSFNKIIEWIDLIKEKVELEEKVLYLLGNKIDLEPKERQIIKEEAEKFAKSKNAKYFETSARTKKGINEAFEEMFKDIYEKYKKNNNINNKKKANYLYKMISKKEIKYSPFSNYILDKYNKY